MPLVLKDRVRESSATSGTGTMTLTGAVLGFQTFSSAIGNGNTTYYAITESETANFEVGLGTVGAGTLTRDTVLESSNAGAKVNFGSAAKDVFCTYPAELSVTKDVPNTFTANQIVSVTDNTNAALLVTQTGTGNAFVVEDSTSPDSTPFVIDANGNTLIGTPTAVPIIAGSFAKLQVSEIGAFGILSHKYVNNTTSPTFNFLKSRGAAVGTNTVVQNGDSLGQLSYNGTDGTNIVPAARIESFVDGTPGTNDMPGRLVFSTTADGASSPTERIRINNQGNVGIGTSSPTERLDVNGTVKANVVSATNGMVINSNAVSASYTIPTNFNAMSAGNVTINNGVTVTIPNGSRWVIL